MVEVGLILCDSRWFRGLFGLFGMFGLVWFGLFHCSTAFFSFPPLSSPTHFNLTTPNPTHSPIQHTLKSNEPTTNPTNSLIPQSLPHTAQLKTTATTSDTRLSPVPHFRPSALPSALPPLILPPFRPPALPRRPRTPSAPQARGR